MSSEDNSQDLQHNLQQVFDYIGIRSYNIFILIFGILFFWIDSLELQSLSLTSKVAYCDFQEGPDTIAQYVVASSNAGQAVGGFLLGMFSDRYGRKLGLLIVMLSTMILGCISAAPKHMYGLIIARFFMGIGLGGVHIAATYVQENFPSKNIHSWMLFIQAAGLTAGMVQAAIALGMIPHLGQSSWRFFILVTVAPTVLIIAQYPFIYESPRWLITNGKYKEAKETLIKQAKWSRITIPSNLMDALIPKKIQEKEQNLNKKEQDKSPKQSLKRFFNESKELGNYLGNPKVFIAVSILLYNWFSIGLIVQGAVQILTNISTHGREPFACNRVTHRVEAERGNYTNNVAQSASEIAGCVFVVALMYLIARKFTFAFTYFLVGSALVIQSVVTRPENLYKPWQGKVLIAFQYVALSGVFGNQSILYLVSNEVIVTQFRSRVLGYSTFMYRMGAFVSSFIVVQMNQRKGASKALALMAALAMSSTILMIFMPFDQKGKGLQESSKQYQDIKYQESTNQEGVSNEQNGGMMSQQKQAPQAISFDSQQGNTLNSQEQSNGHTQKQ